MELTDLLLVVGVNLAVVSGVLYVIYRYVIYTMLPELFGQHVKKEEMTILQEKSAVSRVTNEANKRIGESLIENSPLKSVLQYLDEETVDYLMEHPEALPGVIHKWLPVIEAGQKLLPLVQNILESGGKKKTTEFML